MVNNAEVEVTIKQKLTVKQEEYFDRHFSTSFGLAGESQRKLAEDLGVTATTVNRWLKGESYPRRDTYDRLVAKYHWKTGKAEDAVLKAIKPYVGDIAMEEEYTEATVHRLAKLAPYISELTDDQYYQLKDALRRIVRP